MTNRQWLESLTDEELAKVLIKGITLPCRDKYFNCPRDENGEMVCVSWIKCQRLWLQAEHRED